MRRAPLAQGGVRFLRRLRVYADAYAALLRAAHQRGRWGLVGDSFSPSDKLRKRRPRRSLSFGIAHLAGWRAAAHPRAAPWHHSRLRPRPESERQPTGSTVYANPERPARNSHDYKRETTLLVSNGESHLGFRGGAPFRPLFCLIHELVSGDRDFHQTKNIPQPYRMVALRRANTMKQNIKSSRSRKPLSNLLAPRRGKYLWQMVKARRLAFGRPSSSPNLHMTRGSMFSMVKQRDNRQRYSCKWLN